MKLGLATLALGSILVANGASAMPLAPGTHVTGELEQPGAAIDRVQYRNPRELSRDRYLTGEPSMTTRAAARSLRRS